MAYTRKVTSVSPYWDDFASYRNFMRILVNPSRAIQARELTQMQTIAQSQLGRVADHLFKDGSSIIGAKVSVTDNAPFIELLAADLYVLDATPTVVATPADLVGQHIQWWDGVTDSSVTSGTLAEVIAVDQIGPTLRLQLEYRGGKFAVDESFASVNYFDNDPVNFPTKIQNFDNTRDITAIGSGLRARVDPGVVWINGVFVEIAVAQEIFVNKSGTTGTFVIGYEFTETTLESTDGTELDPIDGITLLGQTLTDPAGGSNNGAPGADRYMVTLKLASYTAGSEPANFHQIIKITNNVIEERIEKVQYADILDLLAGRTYDESGSYTIEPFSLLTTKLDNSNFNYEVGPGRAYVFGYERENLSPTKLAATKARTTRDLSGESNTNNYGTYAVGKDALPTQTFTTIAGSQITFTEHKYGTADAVLYEDGTGSVPELVDDTIYYIISIDADTIELASTPANAVAGTNLTITTGGSNHTLTSVQALFDATPDQFDPTAFTTVFLMTGLSGTGSSLGQARVWFLNDVNGKTRIYLGENKELVSDLQTTISLCSVSTGSPVPGTDAFFNIAPFVSTQAVGFNQPILELAPYVKEVTGVNYPTLLKLPKTVGAGAYSLPSGNANDKFDGASDPHDAIAFVVDSGGRIVDFNTGNDGFGNGAFGTAATGGATAQIDASGDHSLLADTYDFFMLINRESAIKRTKALTGPTPITFTTDTGKTPTIITFDGTNNNADLTATTATHFDVAAIETVIRDPAGVGTGPEDVTANFKLNDGQKDFYYDYSSVEALTGTFAAAETYEVTIHYWLWGGTDDYFAANSYTNGSSSWFDTLGGIEGNIPLYENEAGTKGYILRDCLDFRRNITEITTAREIMTPLGTAAVTYKYYLPRWDKIWLDRNGKFGVIEGIAEENPSIPPNKSGTMPLFVTHVNPFVYGPTGTDTEIGSDQITIRMLDHKNYTMDDIRKLESRIRSLEAYTSESQLELDSYSDTVFDKDGLARAKNGIFVDKFTNHSKGFVWSDTYRCTMDAQSGMVRCPFEMNHIQFEFDPTPAGAMGPVQTNVSQGHTPSAPEIRTEWTNTITLDYTVVSWLVQPLASETMNINPFAVMVWAGEVILNPVSDTWIETAYAPALQIQDPDEAERIRVLYERDNVGIPLWGAWSSQVIGREGVFENFAMGVSLWSVWRDGVRVSQGPLATRRVRVGTNVTTQNTRTGTQIEQSGTEIITKEMGERTLDISTIPFMRVIDVAFEAFGMRPDTVVAPYFADVDITANVVWDGGNPGGLTTKAGYIKGVFTVPVKTFRTGMNVFSLKDTPSNPLTVASTEFRAEGTLYTKQKNILSVEVPSYTTRAIEENNTEITRTNWVDPIAQTFLIEDSNGVFIESIDVFFATKDRYLPVTLYIVETIAGVPGQKRVPFSTVTVDADDVIATRWEPQPTQAAGENLRYNGDHYNTGGTVLAFSDGDEVTTPTTPADFAATKFSFSDALFLKEGVEYAFVLVSNSNEYNAYISRMGQYDIISDPTGNPGGNVNAISKQPHLGSLLKSQNTSTWTPDQFADIKFEIHRCNFLNSASQLYLRTKGETSLYGAAIAYFIDDLVLFDAGAPWNNLERFICIQAGTGNDPDDTAFWTRVEPGYYDATMLNISMDDLLIPGTSVIRQYLSDPDTSWTDFSNKEDILLTAKDNIELYIEGEAHTVGNEPEAINLKLQMFTDSTWHSPVINKNRSSAALINNLVRTPDADKPASNPTWDAGEYISETTQLKEFAADLKLLLDIKKPNAQALVVPKYRIIKEDLRYADRDPRLGGTENPFADNDLKDELVYVYHIETDFTTTGAITDLVEKGTAIVDGLDSVNARVYFSSISEPEDWLGRTDLPGTVVADSYIMVTTEPSLLTADVEIWTGLSIGLGQYAFNPADKNLYRNDSGAATTLEPTLTSTVWTLVPMALVEVDPDTKTPNGTLLDTDVEWRPMVESGTINTNVDTTKFVEYEFEPTVTPSEEFDNFAIKIEMYSGDEVNVPECKRLRVIAVN